MLDAAVVEVFDVLAAGFFVVAEALVVLATGFFVVAEALVAALVVAGREVVPVLAA